MPAPPAAGRAEWPDWRPARDRRYLVILAHLPKGRGGQGGSGVPSVGRRSIYVYRLRGPGAGPPPARAHGHGSQARRPLASSDGTPHDGGGDSEDHEASPSSSEQDAMPAA